MCNTVDMVTLSAYISQRGRPIILSKALHLPTKSSTTILAILLTDGEANSYKHVVAEGNNAASKNHKRNCYTLLAQARKDCHSERTETVVIRST